MTAMTADERAAALLRHLSDLTWAEYDRRAAAVVAAAVREAEAAAAARQREADAALLESWAAEAQAAAFEWHALVAHRLRQAAAALRAGGGGAG
jgi:uncharacterized protein YcbK (DUF882 family)